MSLCVARGACEYDGANQAIRLHSHNLACGSELRQHGSVH
jgi:hypothetical protein